MILGNNKKEEFVYKENTSNNKLLDFWYRYNKLIIIVGILFILGIIVLILINSSHNNQEPEVDNSAYIGIETIMVMNAKKYVTNNKLEINEIGKYLSLNYLNLIVKEEYHCNSNSGVQISKKSNEIRYTPYLVCDEYQSNAIKEIILENEKIEELKIIGSNPYFITKSYNELGYNIDDKYTVNITGVNDIEPGVNLIKYNVLKNNSYYKTANRIVIAENIRGSYPELVLEGKETMTIPKGSTYVELGYKAVDKIDGTITDRVIVTSNLDASKVGTYKINYVITNNRGLTTSLTRTIIVNDSDLALKIEKNIQKVGKNANITLTITGVGYAKTILPNKEESTSTNPEYVVYKNGTYTFIVYDKNNNSEVYDVIIDILDQVPPVGTCKAKVEDGKTTITVSANDESGISKYEYVFVDKTISSEEANYNYNKESEKVSVNVYDTYDNMKAISCDVEVIYPISCDKRVLPKDWGNFKEPVCKGQTIPYFSEGSTTSITSISRLRSNYSTVKNPKIYVASCTTCSSRTDKAAGTFKCPTVNSDSMFPGGKIKIGQQTSKLSINGVSKVIACQDSYISKDYIDWKDYVINVQWSEHGSWITNSKNHEAAKLQMIMIKTYALRRGTMVNDKLIVRADGCCFQVYKNHNGESSFEKYRSTYENLYNQIKDYVIVHRDGILYSAYAGGLNARIQELTDKGYSALQILQQLYDVSGYGYESTDYFYKY